MVDFKLKLRDFRFERALNHARSIEGVFAILTGATAVADQPLTGDDVAFRIARTYKLDWDRDLADPPKHQALAGALSSMKSMLRAQVRATLGKLEDADRVTMKWERGSMRWSLRP